MGIDGIGMARIGGENEALFTRRQQVVQTHEPRHALVIDHHAAVAQLGGHATVTVAAVLQHNALDKVAHRHVGLTGFVFGIVAVEARPTDLRDLAGVIGLEALKRHHSPDFGVDAVAPGSAGFRRNSFTRLKALRKKSRSSAC